MSELKHPSRKDAAMTPEELPVDEEMDRWAIPLFEAPPVECEPVTEEDFPLRIDAMPVEGFHPQLRFFRNAG